MTLTRHYSLSSLLEALPAASVDAEADLEKHASISSLSSGSRYSDYDGYFYIWNLNENKKKDEFIYTQ